MYVERFADERGVVVARRLTCVPINAVTSRAPTTSTAQTKRERLHKKKHRTRAFTQHGSFVALCLSGDTFDKVGTMWNRRMAVYVLSLAYSYRTPWLSRTLIGDCCTHRIRNRIRVKQHFLLLRLSVNTHGKSAKTTPKTM